MGIRDKMKQLAEEGERLNQERQADKAVAEAEEKRREIQRFEYDVVELREKLLDAKGSAPTEKLRSLLNDRAVRGWQLKHLVSPK